jgi:hypothetical protein
MSHLKRNFHKRYYYNKYIRSMCALKISSCIKLVEKERHTCIFFSGHNSYKNTISPNDAFKCTTLSMLLINCVCSWFCTIRPQQNMNEQLDKVRQLSMKIGKL